MGGLFGGGKPSVQYIPQPAAPAAQPAAPTVANNPAEILTGTADVLKKKKPLSMLSGTDGTATLGGTTLLGS